MTKRLALNCTRCTDDGEYREYHTADDPSDNVVRCAHCGKRHSLAAVEMVRAYEVAP